MIVLRSRSRRPAAAADEAAPPSQEGGPGPADDDGEWDFEYVDEEDDEGRPVRTAIEWGLIIIGAFVAALLIKTFLFQAFYIPSSSMEPTLKISDRVLVNKLSYRFGEPDRGDLVVFHRPPGAGQGLIEGVEVRDLIKRVIALPGETVSARDGRVVVDGEVLEEPYLESEASTFNLDATVVPADHYFVLGDNRGDSKDSRTFGPIDEDLIIGRAFMRVWPLSDLSFL